MKRVRFLLFPRYIYTIRKNYISRGDAENREKGISKLRERSPPPSLLSLLLRRFGRAAAAAALALCFPSITFQFDRAKRGYFERRGEGRGGGQKCG